MTILDELAQTAYKRVAESKLSLSGDRVKADALALPKGNFEFEKALKKQDISFICECKKASPSKGLIAKEFPYLDIAKEYIRNNYSKALNLDEVSYFVNISPYYFSKIFKEGTGENFIEYLTNIRMEKAKELLNSTDYSMKEICAMVGYSDPNYFSRSFKKNVGVTPTEYKEGKGEM